MRPDVVVDIGNTQIKWGRCSASRVEESCSLAHDSEESWAESLRRWDIREGSRWVLAGVAPTRQEGIRGWLVGQGQRVETLSRASQLPIEVALEAPDHVGIDRLLDAVAVNHRRPKGSPAVIVDAGSAVTVDCLGAEGAFLGGAIMPGMRLMAKSLHDYTALLPLVSLEESLPPPMPANATIPAMVVGITWAVIGGIKGLIASWRERLPQDPKVYLTGGDRDRIAWALPEAEVWPEMTLEGIRLSAEALV